ncbi:MAG: cation transporter [Acidobacteriota bacterium]
MTSHALTNETKRASSVRRGKWLEYFTIFWNLLEGIVSVGAGLLSGSIALVGFGFDSFIESASGGILLWRLHLDHPERRLQAERFSLKLIGISFLLLAAYVSIDAVKSLVQREPPEVSYLGIGIAALSLIVMPLLANAKRSVAKGMHSHAMEADARQTDICTYLSAILLGGLFLNAVFGWWWADPVAALVMIPIITREGIGALRGETCDDCHSGVSTSN